MFVHLTEAKRELVRPPPEWSRRVDAVHTVFREIEVGHEYDFEPYRCREMSTSKRLLVGEESSVREHHDAETLCGVLPDYHVAVLETDSTSPVGWRPNAPWNP